MNCTGDLLSALKEPTVNLRIQMKKEWLTCTQAAHAKSACPGPEGLGGIALKFPKEVPLKPLAHEAYGFLRTWVIFLASRHKQSPWSGRELDLLTTGLPRGHLWGDQSWRIQQQPLAKSDLVNSGSSEDSGPCVRVRVVVGARWVKGLFHPRIFGDCGLGPKEGWKFTSLFLFLFLLLFFVLSWDLKVGQTQSVPTGQGLQPLNASWWLY